MTSTSGIGGQVADSGQMTTQQLADAVGVHPNTIRRWTRTGRLKPVTRAFGRNRVPVYSQADLEEARILIGDVR